MAVNSSRGKQAKTRKYSHMSEEELKKCIQLRFGSDDITAAPIRSWTTVAEILGVQASTLFVSFKNFKSRSSFFDARKLMNGTHLQSQDASKVRLIEFLTT